MKKIHAILICYGNPQQTLTRWKRDMLPALQESGHDFFCTVIDNTESGPSDELSKWFGNHYRWMESQNLQYGPSINLAVQEAPCGSEYTFYCCSRHGTARDHTYLQDLIAPFNNPEVGLAGYLMGSNSPEGVAAYLGKPWVKERFQFTDEHGSGYVPQHVQGGIWMGRTKALLENPFHEDLPHIYSDHYLTWQLMKAGWKCVDVLSILSVWRSAVHNLPSHIKFVHADNFV